MTAAAIVALVVTVAIVDPLRSRFWAVSLACALALILGAAVIETVS